MKLGQTTVSPELVAGAAGGHIQIHAALSHGPVGINSVMAPTAP